MADRTISACNIANHALTAPLDPFLFRKREGTVRKKAARRHYAAARASPVA
jgi:hypothetical protein